MVLWLFVETWFSSSIKVAANEIVEADVEEQEAEEEEPSESQTSGGLLGSRID